MDALIFALRLPIIAHVWNLYGNFFLFLFPNLDGIIIAIDPCKTWNNLCISLYIKIL